MTGEARLMIQLDPDECRVLGVLVEKAMTTPDQYPLSMNSLATGCSQKSNRNPVKSYEEPLVYDTIDRLRAKGLVVEAHLSSSRVPRFRHNARETLGVEKAELVLLTEMLLRGPQTLGELRGRASRMHPFASTDDVKIVIDTLMRRDPPFVQRIAPAPGSRAERYGQLLCPDLHPVDVTECMPGSTPPVPAAGQLMDTQLVERVDRLETEVAELRRMIEAITHARGETDT